MSDRQTDRPTNRSRYSVSNNRLQLGSGVMHVMTILLYEGKNHNM